MSKGLNFPRIPETNSRNKFNFLLIDGKISRIPDKIDQETLKPMRELLGQKFWNSLLGDGRNWFLVSSKMKELLM